MIIILQFTFVIRWVWNLSKIRRIKKTCQYTFFYLLYEKRNPNLGQTVMWVKSNEWKIDAHLSYFCRELNVYFHSCSFQPFLELAINAALTTLLKHGDKKSDTHNEMCVCQMTLLYLYKMVCNYFWVHIPIFMHLSIHEIHYKGLSIKGIALFCPFMIPPPPCRNFDPDLPNF